MRSTTAAAQRRRICSAARRRFSRYTSSMRSSDSPVAARAARARRWRRAATPCCCGRGAPGGPAGAAAAAGGAAASRVASGKVSSLLYDTGLRSDGERCWALPPPVGVDGAPSTPITGEAREGALSLPLRSRTPLGLRGAPAPVAAAGPLPRRDMRSPAPAAEVGEDPSAAAAAAAAAAPALSAARPERTRALTCGRTLGEPPRSF